MAEISIEDILSIAYFHVWSKVCITPFHVRSKVYKFDPHMDGNNADFALHMEGSYADFTSHMERRHSCRDQIIAKFAIFANIQRIFFLNHLNFRSLYDLYDHFWRIFFLGKLLLKCFLYEL